MAVESQASSLLWDSSSSPLQFHSSSLSILPNCYDRSLVASLTLNERKPRSQSNILQIPPIKIRSTLTWDSSEEENLLRQSRTQTSEREIILFKQKFDRLRASLSQSLEDSRHTFDKIHYKKTSIQQNLDERDRLIDQLLILSIEMNEQIKNLKDEITKQRRRRDREEMKQLKLQRKLTKLNQTNEQSKKIIQTNDRQKCLDEYNNRLLKLQNQYKKELAYRDEQIDQLKEQLSDEFHYQSDEYIKLLKATEQACDLENQKRDLLKEYVDDYEMNIYRARKPCCISTSHRLCKVSTELRLYLVLELALHELFHSSCSCGLFRRSYQTFMRLHQH